MILARIAQALDLPYLRLMELAGYLDEADLASGLGRTPRPNRPSWPEWPSCSPRPWCRAMSTCVLLPAPFLAGPTPPSADSSGAGSAVVPWMAWPDAAPAAWEGDPSHRGDMTKGDSE